MFKSILSPILQPLARWYLSETRFYKFNGLTLRIIPGVFHPGLFFSTKILVRLVEATEVRGKTLLELGAGSGLISFVATQLGAFVTATDINSKVIENLHFNSQANGLKLEILLSDLFRNIPEEKHFDFILINPPYYPKDPKNEDEKAWYCGGEFEYFTALFGQLKTYSFGKAWMILSEDCDLERIGKTASEKGVGMTLYSKEKSMWEWNFVYELRVN